MTASHFSPGQAPEGPAFRAPLSLRAKWAVFRALEALSVWRSGTPIPPVANPEPPASHRKGSLWLYVSTIGELNAIEPFLTLLLDKTRGLPLTLVSDRRVYRKSYLDKYPQAYVYEIDGTSRDFERLAALTPPRLFVIAEIPCLPSDGPCRLPFAALHVARSRGARIALVNGWLYGYAPPSRMDAVERKLFARDYLRSMDVITVQTEEVRRRLIAEGAHPDVVHVTGNTKFDAVTQHTWSPAGKRSETLLRSILDSGRPCIVAGCVTELADQLMILDAFDLLRREVPDALLVLAPRHPEQTDRMRKLEDAIATRGYAHAFRSRSDAPVGPGLQLLVLDTMGELRDFYAVATVAYVGRDHNILEPLGYGKPTTISSGWERTFPSYPVYELLSTAGAVHESSDPAGLASAWARFARDAASEVRATDLAHPKVAALQGASARNMACLARTVFAGGI